ncbi:MAG: hypothetical protein WA632_07715, partial [Gallionella sp.]
MRIFASLNQLPLTVPSRVGLPVSGGISRLFAQGSVIVLVIFTVVAMTGEVCAAPGDILFQDNFERSNPGTVGNGWTVTAAAGACTGVAPTVVPAVFPTAT